MTGVRLTALSAIIAEGGRQARNNTDAAIRGLAEVAERLDMRETADSLRQTREQLRSDTFKLVVMGRFKNGKSTLLNALLGGTTTPVAVEGNKGPMVVDDLPATATLTGVHYAEKPYVRACGFDGSSEEWSFARYLRDSTLDEDEQVNQQRFQAIKEFEMGYPARLCKEGVLVYDSPGLDDRPSRTLITREAAKTCDAAVIVYRSDTLMGESELNDAASVVAEGTRLFTVVNLWHGRKVDDRLRKYVWNKYVRYHNGGPAWNDNQDLSKRDIYFVNAELARNGRYDDDEASVEASGLADFERALAKFLIENRQLVHLEKFAKIAVNLCADIDTRISQRQTAAQQDREDLKARYVAVPAKLEANRVRPNKLPKLFAHYRVDAEATLTTSFARLVARIREELPDYLESVALPSGERFTRVLHQRQLQAEAAAAVSNFVVARVDAWSSQDVKTELSPILERLAEEIESEIDAIGRELDEIHLQLGWGDLDASGSAVRSNERVLAAVEDIGLATGAITGSASGWRGAAGSVAGAVGVSFLMGALGVTSLVVFAPAALAAALVLGVLASGKGLESRLKAKVRQECDKLIAQMPDQLEPVIRDHVAQSFAFLETNVTKQVRALIEEEERHIAQGIELNQSEQIERDRAIASLNETDAAFRQHRHALKQAIVDARQTV